LKVQVASFRSRKDLLAFCDVVPFLPRLSFLGTPPDLATRSRILLEQVDVRVLGQALDEPMGLFDGAGQEVHVHRGAERRPVLGRGDVFPGAQLTDLRGGGQSANAGEGGAARQFLCRPKLPPLG